MLVDALKKMQPHTVLESVLLSVQESRHKGFFVEFLALIYAFSPSFDYVV